MGQNEPDIEKIDQLISQIEREKKERPMLERVLGSPQLTLAQWRGLIIGVIVIITLPIIQSGHGSTNSIYVSFLPLILGFFFAIFIRVKAGSSDKVSQSSFLRSKLERWSAAHGANAKHTNDVLDIDGYRFYRTMVASLSFENCKMSIDVGDLVIDSKATKYKVLNRAGEYANLQEYLQPFSRIQLQLPPTQKQVQFQIIVKQPLSINADFYAKVHGWREIHLESSELEKYYNIWAPLAIEDEKIWEILTPQFIIFLVGQAQYKTRGILHLYPSLLYENGTITVYFRDNQISDPQRIFQATLSPLLERLKQILS